MFNGCEKLNYIKMLATDISAEDCLSNWTLGVSKTGTFVKASGVEIPSGISGIPSGWTVSEPTPEPAENVVTVNGVSFKMVSVKGGTFNMGSTSGESDEKPVHSVTLSDYAIGETEVTQELWRAVMGTNPSEFKGDKKPVERVSWNDCQTFITKLNQLTGGKFRLPTEAEWEFAARGGVESKGYTYSGSNRIGDVAWYSENSSSKTHDVGTKAANELGIYDMSGNVYEWCQDFFISSYYSSSPQNNPTGPSSGSGRVSRGGSWGYAATFCRSSCRDSYSPSIARNFIGLRLAL
ncbi:MAG: formylglycine-generating enzyme family protein [Bacteroidaceae bacterium]|nr:formylglycine-generating enzyme family protein [Bacteroidaceae bacterium]